MIQLELEPELQEAVHRAASAYSVTDAFVVQEAVRKFVEDREDYLAGVKGLSETRYTISLEEMERRAELAD